jgi:hypothetical protein
MTEELARERSRQYLPHVKTAHATSDGTLYFNGDEKAIEKTAKANKLKVYYIKTNE